MIKSEKCIDNKRFCKNESCMVCFNKSVASFPLSAHIVNTNANLRHVSKKGKFLFDWYCQVCDKIFLNQRIDCIFIKGYFCPYCNINYDESFASHPKSIYWSDKNTLKPHQIYKQTHETYWFNCNVCKHEFKSITHNIVTGGNWCPYCSPRTLIFM